MEFWAVINAVYSDDYGVAKTHNASSIAFYVDMAKVWRHDADAKKSKATAYYEYVAEH